VRERHGKKRSDIYVNTVRETGALERASNVDAAAPYVILWLTSSDNTGS